MRIYSIYGLGIIHLYKRFPSQGLITIKCHTNISHRIVRLQQIRTASRTIHKVRISLHVSLLIEPRQNALEKGDDLVFSSTRCAELGDPQRLPKLGPEASDVCLEGGRVEHAAVPVKRNEVDRTPGAVANELVHIIYADTIANTVRDCWTTEKDFAG